MSELAPAALEFLRKHLNYDARNYIAKKRMRSQMEKFWRRKEKAEAEIAILPPGHADLEDLNKEIAAAEKLAQDGHLKEAYKALDTTKTSARAKADTVKNGLTIHTVLADLNPLYQKVVALKSAVSQAELTIPAQAVQIESKLAGLAKAEDGTDRDDILWRAGRAIALRTELRGELDKLDGVVTFHKNAINTAFMAPPAVTKTLKTLRHNAPLLREAGKLDQGSQARILMVEQAVVDYKMEGFSGNSLSQALATRAYDARQRVERECAEAMALPDMGTSSRSTDKAGNRIDPDAEALPEELQRFEKEQEDRLELARERMRADRNYDIYLERVHEDSPAVVLSQVASFDTSDVFDQNDLGYDPADPLIQADRLAADASQKLEAELDGAITAYTQAAGASKVPDEVLEVASRTSDQWCAEVARAMGLSWTPDALPLSVVEKIRTTAAAMQAKAAEIYPDKAQGGDNGLESFTMGGVLYDDVRELGAGGGGRVYLAKSANGATVVIKEPLRPEDDEYVEKSPDELISEFGGEVFAQRAVTGGENGPCHDNLMEHKGMVLSPSGIPLPVMDLADAGDADEFDKTMGALSDSGVISEASRQVLMAAQMQDMLKGVKAMHDQGHSHFDLKELNVFMMKDGTFKVADFGLSQEAPTRDAKLEGDFQSTPLYLAPETKSATDLTMQGDAFSLGAILQRAVSPMQDLGRVDEMMPSFKDGGGAYLDEKGNQIEVSAATRLIARLMSDDPSERPNVETALEATYFDEINRDYDPAQVDRLRKAAAEYAATVGRRTKELDAKIAGFKGTIAENEAILSRANLTTLIGKGERMLERTQARIGRIQEIMQSLTDPAEVKKQQDLIDSLTKDMTNMRLKIDGYKNEVGQPLRADKAKRMREAVERNRKGLVEAQAEVKQIREDPQYAQIVKELQEANAAFR